MPSGKSEKKRSDDRGNPYHRRLVPPGIGLAGEREYPNRKQGGEQHRKRYQRGCVRHGNDSREPKERRVGKGSSEIERLSDEEDRCSVQEASEKRHGVSRLTVIADEKQDVRRSVRGERRRYEDGEFLPIGKDVPIGGEIEDEPHAHERRADNRQDGDELRRGGLFGLQPVVRQKPFGLGLGHDSRLDERRHVGGKFLVKV